MVISGDNNITQSYRKFQTSALDNWDDLSDLVKCYHSDSSSTKPDSNAYLSKLIQTYMRRQSETLDVITRYASEIRSLLNIRKIDRYKPKLIANNYYLEMDERVKTEYLREVAREHEAERKQLAMRFDYAEVYLSALPDAELSNRAAVDSARDKCLADLKQIWKRRVEHCQAELSRIRGQLGKSCVGGEEEREALKNECVVVERVLAQYTDRELFAEKCEEMEKSFEEYVRRKLGDEGKL